MAKTSIGTGTGLGYAPLGYAGGRNAYPDSNGPPGFFGTNNDLGYPGGRNAYANNQGPTNFFGTSTLGYPGGRNAYANNQGPSNFFGSIGYCDTGTHGNQGSPNMFGAQLGQNSSPNRNRISALENNMSTVKMTNSGQTLVIAFVAGWAVWSNRKAIKGWFK